MAVPCAVSPTGCLGSPASCCSGRRCSTPPMTRGQRRSPEPPPKATRRHPLHPTHDSDHVAEHWSLISGRKSHQALSDYCACTYACTCAFATPPAPPAAVEIAPPLVDRAAAPVWMTFVRDG